MLFTIESIFFNFDQIALAKMLHKLMSFHSIDYASKRESVGLNQVVTCALLFLPF